MQIIGNASLKCLILDRGL